jgi:cytochrome c biogenesis protein CcmG/thiol:disulfide interchange protein DsbE
LRKTILAILALAVIVAGIYFLTHGQHARVRVGCVAPQCLAPDFTLSDLAGQRIQLSSFRGKVVLLDFWATWCDPCKEETPRFVELQRKYGEQGLQIIGISIDDDPEPVRSFYQHFKVNYPVAMGDARMAELYGGVLGLPIAFLIGRDGRIAAKYIGATDTTRLEKEIVGLLRSNSGANSPN